MFLAFFTLLLLVAEYFGMLSSRTPRTPRLPNLVWVALLVVSYAVQLGVIRYAALNQPGMPDWRLTMPIPVIDDRGLPTANGDIVTAVMLVLAALQSYALLALYRAQTLSRPLLWIGLRRAARSLALRARDDEFRHVRIRPRRRTRRRVVYAGRHSVLGRLSYSQPLVRRTDLHALRTALDRDGASGNGCGADVLCQAGLVPRPRRVPLRRVLSRLTRVRREAAHDGGGGTQPWVDARVRRERAQRFHCDRGAGLRRRTGSRASADRFGIDCRCRFGQTPVRDLRFAAALEDSPRLDALCRGRGDAGGGRRDIRGSAAAPHTFRRSSATSGRVRKTSCIASPESPRSWRSFSHSSAAAGTGRPLG